MNAALVGQDNMHVVYICVWYMYMYYMHMYVMYISIDKCVQYMYIYSICKCICVIMFVRMQIRCCVTLFLRKIPPHTR